MTKTTTTNSPFTIFISWFIALALCAGLVIYLKRLPETQNVHIQLKEKNLHQPVRSLANKNKTAQSQRPLPQEYAGQLVKKAEQQAKNDLKARLEKFEEMSANMRKRKNEMLGQVEHRKLPASAPADANNTVTARNIPKAGQPPLPPDPTVEDLYEMLRQYETEIQKNHLAVSAAKQSLSEGLSFPEVYRSLQAASSHMPAFEKLVSSKTTGQDGKRNPKGNTSLGLQVNNTADLNNYRGLLGEASVQSGLAGARLENLFGIPGSPGKKGGPGSGATAGGGKGKGDGDGGMGVNFSNTASKTPMKYYEGATLDQEMVKMQALPGRRFSKNASRKGWLYVNTWYMIGPWEDYGQDDFSIVHPPEVAIDLDAVYTDGQVGTGIEETDSDPLKMDGPKVKLDGTLRWKFMQSESMHNTVPVTTDHATYYAYTELYFDEATSMMVALGTDDAGRVWINGKDVWQDTGTSWYHIDENIVPFQFQQGWNRVLVRLENSGGGATGFSFLICPRSAIRK